MKHGTTYVGLDVHKDSIAVAGLFPGHREVREMRVANEGQALRRLARQLRRQGKSEVICCYEAGMCGYAVQRALQTTGVTCKVVAPSLVPRKPGERIKTDRRDARKLAELLRAGLLTEVHPPTPEEEAVRDLCRAREDAQQDLVRSRHRLDKMLVRKGITYPAKRKWTHLYGAWLRRLQFEVEAERIVFQSYLLTVEQREQHVRHLDAVLEQMTQRPPYRQAAGWLRCLRGVNTVTAMTVLAELHGFRRFESPRQLMAYLGLVPSEHSSGASRHRGRITRSGNSHVRRLLVESGWQYQHRPSVSRGMRQRREGQPPWVLALADRAQQRLHRRYWRLTLQGKPKGKAVIAVARELVGFIWALLYRDAAERAA